MSMSDCINCWDTPCTCGWHSAHLNADALITIAHQYLLKAKSVEKHKLKRAEPTWMDTSSVYCTECGLTATYKTWNKDFFNRECKTDED